MKIHWTASAAGDLRDIAVFIAKDNSGAARSTVNRIRERVKKLKYFPMSGRIVPEFDLESIREVIFGNYRIVYLLQKKSLTVLTIFEGHRLFSIEDEDLSK